MRPLLPDVLDLLAVGKQDDEIAETLGLTPTSVRSHASTILTKLVHAQCALPGA